MVNVMRNVIITIFRLAEKITHKIYKFIEKLRPLTETAQFKLLQIGAKLHDLSLYHSRLSSRAATFNCFISTFYTWHTFRLYSLRFSPPT